MESGQFAKDIQWNIYISDFIVGITPLGDGKSLCNFRLVQVLILPQHLNALKIIAFLRFYVTSPLTV